MTTRFSLAAVLLIAFSITGCGFLTDTPGPPTQARLTRVAFTDAPLSKPGGGRWDGGLNPSGPDLYLSIQGPDPLVRFSSRGVTDDSVIRNVTEFTLPEEYVASDRGGFTVRDFDAPLAVELRDADFGGSDLIADLGTVVLRESVPQEIGAVTVSSLRSSDGRSAVRLFWTWEEE